MAEQFEYDLAIIGGGPGGYVAAIRAGQLGMKVICIEKEKKLGGTCLRVGCIPSKALLDASEKFTEARHKFTEIGIKVTGVTVDLDKMMGRKDAVVDQLSSGVVGLFKKNGVDRLEGTGRIRKAGEVQVRGDGWERVVTAKWVLIATGSVPVELPFMKFDGKRIISSDQAIGLKEVPGRMVVVGAGAIGLELGSVWNRLGSKVTVVEMLPGVVPGADEEVAKGLEKVLRKQGLEFYFGAKVTGTVEAAEGFAVGFDHDGQKKEELADIVLVAVGRRAYTESLGLAELNLKTDAKGRVEVNAHYETNVPGVFAIGDVIAGPMLAHKAEEEGIACVERMAGKAGHVNYDVIPGVVYTSPELAWVGLTEEQCAAKGLKVNVGKFRFAANGRALCMDEAEGFVKIVADAKTDRVLGVHIVGPQASCLVSEAAMAMEFGASSEDIARTCHAHPTLPEAVKEAALAVAKRAIHS